MANPKPLFLSQAPEGCNPAYRNLIEVSHGRAAIAREQCERLWRDFSDLADHNFLERFPFDFHQRWFEMYLGATLREAGLDVRAAKAGPDFRVLVDDGPIYIEAIAPKPGDPYNPDAVKEPVYRDEEGKPMAARVPHDQITLRLAHAFRAKAEKYDRYRRDGRIGADDRCIIAINLREIPHAWADDEEFWFRALYGAGNRFVAIDRAGSATMAGREHRMLLKTTGGAEIDVAPLLRPDQRDICGVLGSAADGGNVPRPLGDDFVLMPHAAARAPYPRAFIKRGAEVFLNATDEGERWTVETVDYGAHAPRGPERVTIEVEGERVDFEWAVDGRELSLRVGSRDYTQLLAGGVDTDTVAREIATEIAKTQKRARQSRPKDLRK